MEGQQTAEPQAAPSAPPSAPPAPAGNILSSHQAPPDLNQGGASTAPKFNPDEWKNYLPEDVRNHTSLGPVKTLEGLVKNYIHAQQMVGADKIPVPGPHTGEEEWKKIYQKLGVPESIDKYELKMPSPDSVDSEFINNFKMQAHGAGLLPHQAQKLVNWYEQTSKSVAKQVEEQEAARISQAKAELEKEWGQEYQAQVTRAESAISKIFGDKADEIFADDTLPNNPKFIRFAAQVGKLLGEDKFHDGKPRAFGETVDEIQKKIASHMGDFKGAYHDRVHPDHQRAVDEVAALHEKLRLAGAAR